MIDAFKQRHGIATGKSCFEVDPAPWTALLIPPGETRSVKQLCEDQGISMYESGKMVDGETELSAIRELCQRNGIQRDL